MASVISYSRDEDFSVARRMLRRLADFDDDGKPMREAEWRRAFLVATRGLGGKQRAQLWADKLAYEGVAFNWLETQKNASADSMQAIKDWVTLEPMIEQRWPTPARNPNTYTDQCRRRWEENRIDVGSMVLDLLSDSGSVKPHETWARQHLALGRETGLDDRQLVFQTLSRAIPPWLISLLPKQHQYQDAFEEMCTDIGAISSRDIYYTFMQQRMREALDAKTHHPKPSSSARQRRDTSSASDLSVSPSCLVAEDTPEEWERHSRLVRQWRAKYGDKNPSSARPYPLSPGTMKPELGLCVRCGRGLHPALECRAHPTHVLSEHERMTRIALQQKWYQRVYSILSKLHYGVCALYFMLFLLVFLLWPLCQGLVYLVHLWHGLTYLWQKVEAAISLFV